jgi:hypothetical protein
VSKTGYKYEAEVNHELGLTFKDLYDSLDDNTIYAGKQHLTQERRDKYDAASVFQYRHCKVMNRDPRFMPPTHEPTFSRTVIDNNEVIVTNKLQSALDFLSGYQPRLHVVVDNEADRGYTNALIIYIPQAKRVLLFHGPKVHSD